MHVIDNHAAEQGERRQTTDVDAHDSPDAHQPAADGWPGGDTETADMWALMLVPIAICIALAVYASIFG